MTKTYADTYREVLETVADIKVDVWQSKYEVVDEEGIFRLLHYQPIVEQRCLTPLLIVCAWINRPYVLDLQPEISVVRKYLEAGLDVYMVDWGYASTADQYLDLDDYMDYLDKSMHYIKEANGVKQLSIHGYCLGGTLSTAYCAIRQQNVKNLILQATPINFHVESLLCNWSRTMDPDKIAAAYHVAPGEFLNIGFLLADPINLIVGKYEGFLDMIASRKGMSDFLRMEQWIFDSPNIPGQAYRQYIREWYHENRLMKGEFKALGEKVDLRRIEIPILVLMAEQDHIAPPDSQKAILDLVSSKDKELMQLAKGHIGITTSRASHREFWPRVVTWLGQRSEGIGSPACEIPPDAEEPAKDPSAGRRGRPRRKEPAAV